MVDIKPLEEQLKEVKKQHKLPAATEKRISTLLTQMKTLTERQANILYKIINRALNGFSTALSIEELNILSTINIFSTTDSTIELAAYQENISKAFRFGIQFINKTPDSLVLALEQSVIQSSMKYITSLGDTYKQQIGSIIADGIKKSLQPNDISNNIKVYLNQQKWQADRIVRTETMRAAHNGSYAQARRDGMNHYVIDGRAEFCSSCRKISAEGPFEIDDTSHLPPLHPNCACIPVYYSDLDTAQKDHDYLQSQINKQRQAIEKKGYTIKPDGTGTVVNKTPVEERIHN